MYIASLEQIFPEHQLLRCGNGSAGAQCSVKVNYSIIPSTLDIAHQPLDLLVKLSDVQDCLSIYATLALYLNMSELFDLRVFRPVGVPVYIIMKIMGNVLWLFLALGLPSNFFTALSTTTFFLPGRFEPIGDFLDHGMASFLTLMILFYVFTAPLISTILIARMGDAFTQCKQEGNDAWSLYWLEVIADLELSLISINSRYNRNMFADYIYYRACEKMALDY
ncbi:hypothetical protein B0O80DRAFT_500032 [Mortierella sp. GBAus27b]|nr:hypothetical protein B0O80DRAFT_500032 [Mortierella sp. GBAus27b]